MNFYLTKILKKIFENYNQSYSPLSRNMGDCLNRISKLGFIPSTIIDVGVASGTYELYEAYPNSKIILIEPLIEFKDSIQKIIDTYNAQYIFAAASSFDGEMKINVHSEHLEGSSIFTEAMGSKYDGVPRDVKSVKIDTIIKQFELKAPFLLKIDVQGAEIDVLNGALQTMENCEVILLEVSLFKFMNNAPEISDIILYMKEHNFVVYDIYGGTLRPLDGALGQIDLAFVKEDGIFRRNHSYATEDQWDMLIKQNLRESSH